MTENFRIESLPLVNDKNLIKIYAQSNNELPVKIDCAKRYAVLPENSQKLLEKWRSLEVRKDDVWVITEPKSGTTWTLELAWLLMNDFDYDRAYKVDQLERCPNFAQSLLDPSFDSIEYAKNAPSPRVMKCHLPMHLLPVGIWTVKPKIIYVTRNPGDAIVSSYHFYSSCGFNNLGLDDYVAAYISDRLTFTPHWPHVMEFWTLRNEPYVFFNSYEKMKKDLRLVILKIAAFLQKSVDDEQIEKLLDYLSFQKMKENPACHHANYMKGIQRHFQVKEDTSRFNFVRKGVVGTHKKELSACVIESIEVWTKKSLEPYGITLDDILFS